MNKAAPEKAVLNVQAIGSFALLVILLIVAFIGAAVGSLAPIDFIYDGI